MATTTAWDRLVAAAGPESAQAIREWRAAGHELMQRFGGETLDQARDRERDARAFRPRSSSPMEAILEPAIVEGRFRLVHYDYELCSGYALDVEDPERGWVQGTVEYSHQRRAYYFTEPLSLGDSVTLEELAHRRILVRILR